MGNVNWPRPGSGTVRGIHWSASCGHGPALSNWAYWSGELRAMGVGWVKVLDDSRGSSLALCQALLAMGVVPIVRLYRARPNPGQLDDGAMQAVSKLVAAGVRYFEPNNEPNLADEWDGGQWAGISWQRRVQVVVDGWINDAKRIIAAGGLPGFPALAQCGHGTTGGAIGSIPFYDEAVRYLKAMYEQDTRRLFGNGAWVAVHDAVLNHCYRDGQGQWHFEYPYDPICQGDQPGKTVLQDDNSLIGHRAIQTILKTQFGIDPWFISTEGGVFVPSGGWQQWDTRYPPMTYERQAEATVAMFDWLQGNEPRVLAMCPWLIANERMGHDDPSWTQGAWYAQDGNRPVVAAMKQSAPVLPPSEAQIRNVAWDKLGRPYNPDAAFQKYAGEHDLGYPVTDEFDLNGYRVQGFALGIVYAKIGDWANVKSIQWSRGK